MLLVLVLLPVLYRGAGVSIVWRPFAAQAPIDTLFIALSPARFFKTLSQMA